MSNCLRKGNPARFDETQLLSRKDAHILPQLSESLNMSTTDDQSDFVIEKIKTSRFHENGKLKIMVTIVKTGCPEHPENPVTRVTFSMGKSGK